jgi:hypothetical protein
MSPLRNTRISGRTGRGACPVACQNSGHTTQGAGNRSWPAECSRHACPAHERRLGLPGHIHVLEWRGAYQTMPPWDGFVLQPGFRYARPFGLRSANQFRPGPPPRLDSPQYAAAFRKESTWHDRAQSTTFGRAIVLIRGPVPLTVARRRTASSATWRIGERSLYGARWL